MLPSRFRILAKQYARPFNQQLGSPLIYLFYQYTIIRLKYMVLFHLIFLLCSTIRPKIRSLIDLFLLITIRRKHTILFHLFFFCAKLFDQKLGSTLIYFFYLYTTIRPKIRVLIDFFYYMHTDHLTKLYGPFSFILSQCKTIRLTIRVVI